LKSKSIKLIIQNYPYCWANEIIKEVACRNSIPLVDNAAVFQKLVLRSDYKKGEYFAEDWHCNANGYRMIAENVYNVLTSELVREYQ
jgi:lysophospholipase L1-like esterase